MSKIDDDYSFVALYQSGNIPKLSTNPFSRSPHSSSSFCQSFTHHLAVLCRAACFASLVPAVSPNSTFTRTCSVVYVVVPEPIRLPYFDIHYRFTSSTVPTFSPLQLADEETRAAAAK